MKQKLVQVGKEMGQVEGAIKLGIILFEIPVVPISCVALCGWIGYQTGYFAAGLFLGVFISIPLLIVSAYQTIIFGHKEMEQ